MSMCSNNSFRMSIVHTIRKNYFLGLSDFAALILCAWLSDQFIRIVVAGRFVRSIDFQLLARSHRRTVVGWSIFISFNTRIESPWLISLRIKVDKIHIFIQILFSFNLNLYFKFKSLWLKIEYMCMRSCFEWKIPSEWAQFVNKFGGRTVWSLCHFHRINSFSENKTNTLRCLRYTCTFVSLRFSKSLIGDNRITLLAIQYPTSDHFALESATQLVSFAAGGKHKTAFDCYYHWWAMIAVTVLILLDVFHQASNIFCVFVCLSNFKKFSTDCLQTLESRSEPRNLITNIFVFDVRSQNGIFSPKMVKKIFFFEEFVWTMATTFLKSRSDCMF